MSGWGGSVEDMSWEPKDEQPQDAATPTKMRPAPREDARPEPDQALVTMTVRQYADLLQEWEKRAEAFKESQPGVYAAYMNARDMLRAKVR